MNTTRPQMISKTSKQIYAHMAFGKDRTDILSSQAKTAYFLVLKKALINCRDRDMSRDSEVLEAMENLENQGVCPKRLLKFKQALQYPVPAERFFHARLAFSQIPK